MIPAAEEPANHRASSAPTVRQPPSTSEAVAVIRKASPICQRASCSAPTRPVTLSICIADSANVAAAARESATASMVRQITCAMAAARIGTVRAFSPAMLIRLSPTM